VELLLLIIFFFPGVLALMYSGWGYGIQSLHILESSVNSPAGVPIWPLKMMIPIGATLLALQGVAELLRCVVCLKQGDWEPRLHDVQEMADQILEDQAKKQNNQG
jgi:TRAP-type mannitol/chloroaromatic compound transport system permease small subunit